MYRHFPTKEALFGAIASDRLEHLAARAAELAETEEPGEAFFGYLGVLVEEGKSDQGLADALEGIGYDLAEAFPDAARHFMALLGDLLTRAQQAGAVRADLGAGDVKALLVGCQAMQRTARRTLAVVRDGLTPPGSRRAADD